MQTGPLKSLYLTAMNVEQENLLQQDVFEWVPMPKGKSAGHLTRSRAVFEIKWDQIIVAPGHDPGHHDLVMEVSHDPS